MNALTGFIAGVIVTLLMYQPLVTMIGWNIFKACVN